MSISPRDAIEIINKLPIEPIVPPDELELRRLLAFSHAGVHLYVDDGELQDNRFLPCIDFKRDSVSLIKEKLIARTFNSTANKP